MQTGHQQPIHQQHPFNTKNAERQSSQPPLLLHRASDDFWLVLTVWDHAVWPTGVPRLLVRLVTCPNEPTTSELDEE